MQQAPGPHFERKCFIGLDMWSVLVVPSEKHVIYWLMEGTGRQAQDDMEEIDGE